MYINYLKLGTQFEMHLNKLCLDKKCIIVSVKKMLPSKS